MSSRIIPVITPESLRGVHKLRSASLLEYMLEHKIDRKQLTKQFNFSKSALSAWLSVGKSTLGMQPTHAFLKQLGAKPVDPKDEVRLDGAVEPVRVGAPSKYKPEFCERVVEILKEGRTLTSVLAELDIDKETLHAWSARHSEFSESLKRGLTLSKVWWEETGRTSLKDHPFQTGLWTMNMKNRFGWTDRVVKTVQGPDGGAVRIEHLRGMSDDELLAIAAGTAIQALDDE